MFKVIKQISETEYEVIDTVDNTVDVVEDVLFPMLLLFGMKIQGVSYDAGRDELKFDDDILTYLDDVEEDAEEDYEDYEENVFEGVDEEEIEYEDSFEDVEEEDVEEEVEEEEDEIEYEEEDEDFFDEDNWEYVEGGISSNTMYNYIPESARKIISDYYKWYTKEVYKMLTKDANLKIRPDKAKELAEIKGEANWEFDGIVDTGYYGGATCELGHLLRYKYYALGDNGERIIFGAKCSQDFFQLSKADMSRFLKIRKQMVEEIVQMAGILDKGEIVNQEKDLKLFIQVTDRLYDNGCLMSMLEPKLYDYLLSFAQNNIPYPKSMVRCVKNYLSRSVLIPTTEPILRTANMEALIKGLFGDKYSEWFNDFVNRTGDNLVEIPYLNSYLKFVFTNKIDGIYAYSPYSKETKDRSEGAYNRYARQAYDKQRHYSRLYYNDIDFTLESLEKALDKVSDFMKYHKKYLAIENKAEFKNKLLKGLNSLLYRGIVYGKYQNLSNSDKEKLDEIFDNFVDTKAISPVSNFYTELESLAYPKTNEKHSKDEPEIKVYLDKFNELRGIKEIDDYLFEKNQLSRNISNTLKYAKEVSDRQIYYIKKGLFDIYSSGKFADKL